MKTLSFFFSTVSIALSLAVTTSFAYDALQRRTELQYWDALRADNGYNFFWDERDDLPFGYEGEGGSHLAGGE